MIPSKIFILKRKAPEGVDSPSEGFGFYPVLRLSAVSRMVCGVEGDVRTSVAKIERGEGGDGLLGFEGDGDDLADEAEDVFGSVFAVGVVDDAGAFVGGDLVLVDDPIEGGAVAEAVVEGGGGMPRRVRKSL